MGCTIPSLSVTSLNNSILSLFISSVIITSFPLSGFPFSSIVLTRNEFWELLNNLSGIFANALFLSDKYSESIL